MRSGAARSVHELPVEIRRCPLQHTAGEDAGEDDGEEEEEAEEAEEADEDSPYKI